MEIEQILKRSNILGLIFLLLYACEIPCNRLQVNSKNNSGNNTFLVTYDGKDTCVVRINNRLYFNNNLDKAKVVFPQNGSPGVVNNCSFRDLGIRSFPVRIYISEIYIENIYFGQLDTLFNLVNEIFNDFHLGIAFNPVEKTIIPEDYVFKDKSADLVLNDLITSEIIDTSFTWHLFLLNTDNYQSLAVAQNLSTKSHNMVFGGPSLLKNPIMVAHEFLHSFPGHADLSMGDSRYSSLELVKNIMFNTILPMYPRYSIYQNLQANNIATSDYLGINFFPVDYENIETDLGNIKNYNDQNDFARFIVLNKLDQENIHLLNRMIDYYNNPFYHYLLSIHLENIDYQEIIFNYHAEMNSLSTFIADVKKVISFQAIYLSEIGLDDKEKFIQNNFSTIIDLINKRIELIQHNISVKHS